MDATAKKEKHLALLLKLQLSVSNAMLGFMDKSATERDIITGILHIIVDYFPGSHAYICTIDHSQRTFSCTGEAHSEHIDELVGVRLQNMPFKKGWLDLILAGEAVAIKDAGSDKGEYNEANVFKSVYSSMAAPLIAQEGVWGFIRIDYPEQDEEFEQINFDSFRSTVNMIGLSTAILKSEAKARHTSDWTNKLYQNMPLGYIRLGVERVEEGINYTYQDANQVFLDMMHRTREQIIGRKLSEVGNIYHEKIDPRLLYEAAFENKVHLSRGQLRSNDRWVDVTIYSPQYGDVVALFADVHDITLANEAQLQSEQALKSVFTNIPIGIEVYDREGNMVETNEYNMAMHGISDRGAFLGRNLFSHPGLPEHAPDMLRRGKDVTFDVKIDISQINAHYGFRSGEQIKYLTVKCKVIYNAEGQIETYLVILIDNTALYEAAQRLHEAKIKAEESDQLKSAFLANMSHEIRTPLNAIVGFSRLLADTENPQERSEYFNIIEHNNSHLLNLISDVLDLSKIEAGLFETSRAQINVDELCSNLVKSVSLRCAEGVTVNFLGAPDADCNIIMSDEKHVNQILMNLLTNAAKFTTKGHIDLLYRFDGDMIEFSVADTGIGMSPDQASHVFDRFYKVNDFVPGTGLGLPICYQIIEKMGGRISVASRLGEGTTFTFRVPRG